MLREWAALSVSFYLTIVLVWLGGMVLGVGSRRNAGKWLTGGGLLLGALFFLSHTAILGRGLNETSFGMDFWWWVSWVPAITAPLAWYTVMLWYAGFQLRQAHRHRAWLGVVCGLLLTVLVILLTANPVPTYRAVVYEASEYRSAGPGFPVLIAAYAAFAVLCFLLPIDLVRRPNLSADLLEADARRRARPWLAASSVLLLTGAVVVALTAGWVIQSSPTPSLKNPADVAAIEWFDLAVVSCIALAVTSLGRAIVAYEVFTGSPLPRQGFLSQWRGIVILAAISGTASAGAVVIQLRPVYSLMLAAMLGAVFFILSSLTTFQERERFMRNLRPFVASQGLFRQMVGGEEAQDGLAAARRLFAYLCEEVLGAGRARLAPAGSLAALAGPPLEYPERRDWPGLPDAVPEALFQGSRFRLLPGAEPAWAVLLYNQSLPAGVLFLGERKNGGPYTDEEIDIARAGGERLLDLLAAGELAHVALDLLRQRLAQARVLEGQGRRILHDEVLPELHTSILYLSSLPAQPEIQTTIDTLVGAHRRISDLIRAAPSVVDYHLAAEGLVTALKKTVDPEYAQEFELLEWAVGAGVDAACRKLAPFAVEVVYYAVRELVRNAARHARGAEAGLKVTVRVKFTLQGGLPQGGEWVEILVADDGAGPAAAGEGLASGYGLRFHTAMVAAIGGSLAVDPAPEGGTCGKIRVPVAEAGKEHSLTQSPG